MKIMKSKVLVLLLVLFISISLVACSAKTEAPKPAASAPAPAPAAQVKAPEVIKAAKISNAATEAAANAYFANMPADVYKISEKDFVDKVKAKDKSIFVLDIRTKADYDKGHIKGAVNAPWGVDITAALDKLPQDKTILLYCYTGQTAGQTVVLLNIAGFDAKSVNLGWNLGISKVEGVAEVTDTAAADFGKQKTLAVKPEIKTAIKAYFEDMDKVKGTTWANFKISEDDAKKFVDAKSQDVLFLSVRKAEDYAKGHISGAVNIPFGKGMQEKFSTLPKDKKIIVVCYTGQTAGQTTAVLKMLGYDAVSMNGGMGMASNAPAGWLNKKYPVVQ